MQLLLHAIIFGLRLESLYFSPHTTVQAPFLQPNIEPFPDYNASELIPGSYPCSDDGDPREHVESEIVLSSRLLINHTTASPNKDIDSASTSSSGQSHANDGQSPITAYSSEDDDSKDDKVVADKAKPKPISSYLLTNHSCAGPSSESRPPILCFNSFHFTSCTIDHGATRVSTRASSSRCVAGKRKMSPISTYLMINHSCSDSFHSDSRSSKDEEPNHVSTEPVGEPNSDRKVGSRHVPKQRRISSYLLINHTAASCEPIRGFAPTSPYLSSVHHDVYDDYEKMNLESWLLIKHPLQVAPQRAYGQCFHIPLARLPWPTSSTNASSSKPSWYTWKPTPKKLTTFHLFSTLPYELQHIILSFAAQTSSKNDHLLKHTLLPLIIQRHRIICHPPRHYPTLYSVFLYFMHRFYPTRMALMHSSFDSRVAMMRTWEDIVESLEAYLAKSEPGKLAAWVRSLKVRDGWDEEQAKQRLLVELAERGRIMSEMGRIMSEMGRIMPRSMEKEEEGRVFRERSELGGMGGLN